MFQKNLEWKKLCKRGEYHNFCRQFSVSHAERLFGDHICVLENVWYEEELSNRWGVSRLSVGTFLSHNAEKHCEAPYKLSESLGYRKNLCIIEWYHDFLSKLFSLRVPENFVGDVFRISKSFRFGNKYEKEGSVTIFVNNFLSHMSENFVVEHFCVLEKVWLEKNYV